MDLKRYDTDYGWHEMVESPDGCFYDADEADREILKQKRKRCLAMAKACDKYAFALELQGHGRSTELLKRHNRAIERKYKWLELADKFKECMNA